MEKDMRQNYDFLKIEKEKSKVDIVMSKIRDSLLEKHLLPGDKLPSESDLTKSFSISRGSIREAMKILSAFGIIDIKRGDGTYISKTEKKIPFDPLLFSLIVSYKNFKELFELRELMELSIVRLIIKNAGNKEFKEIEKTLLEMKKGFTSDHRKDYKVTAMEDIKFHIALGKATCNSLVEKLYSFTLDLYKDSIETTHKNQVKAEKAIQFHENIYNALVEKNIEKAVKAIEESMESWKLLL